jgi:hypothetical protein
MTPPMLLDGGSTVPAPFGRWENLDIDALPYTDVLPEGWRPDVDQLVQEEMRRMKKRPIDYLGAMGPAFEIDWGGCPLLQKEFERVQKGGAGGMPAPDTARYDLNPPPKSKRGDEDAWYAAVRNARSSLEHQTLRVQNLELAAKFAPNAWRAHNASLEAAITTYVLVVTLVTTLFTLLLPLPISDGTRITHETSRFADLPSMNVSSFQVRNSARRGASGDRADKHGAQFAASRGRAQAW